MSSKVSGMNTLLSVSARTNNPEPGFQLINQRITHSTINDNIWASLQNAQIQALKTLDQRPAEKFAQQMYETRYADDRTKLPQENQIAQFTAADALAADRQLLTLANEVMVKRLAKGISEQELNEYQQNVQRSLDIQQRSVQQLANTIVNSLIQYDEPAAWIEQEQLLKQMTVENVNTAVKQYLSHPVNTYTGVLLPK